MMYLLARIAFRLLLPLCSVPTPMLRTPTPDQAHRSHRAAWDIQLPPSSRHSTRIRRTGTELHPHNVNALLLMLQDQPHSCLPGNLAWATRMYCKTTPPTCPTATIHPLPQSGVVAPKLYLFLGLDLKRKC